MKQTLLILLSLLIVGCATTTPEIKIPKFKVQPQTQELPLSSIFKLDTAIELSGKLITEINKVVPTDQELIVMGKADNGTLHLLSKSGQLIKTITITGRGPEEVLTIEDIAYDQPTNTIHILSNLGLNIDIYSIDKGQFIEQIDLPEPNISRRLALLDTNYVLYKNLAYTEADESIISVYNPTTNTVEAAFLPIDRVSSEYISFTQHHVLQKTDSCIYYQEAFRDTLYTINNNKQLTPIAIFDKGQYGISAKELKSGYGDVQDFVNFCKSSNYIWAHINTFVFDSKILSTFKHTDVIYFNICDLQTGESNSYTTIKDDLFANQTIDVGNFQIVGSSGDKLLTKYKSTENGNQKIVIFSKKQNK